MTNLMSVIAEQESRFVKLDSANGGILDFKQECLFARQQIFKNEFTTSIAMSNPNSLKSSILNGAAIGISLNPALQHAYLVPRGKDICLDISYRGLVKLATEGGAIKWAKAELVYEKDVFYYKGPSTLPDHTADVFSERGEIQGIYCIARLPDGEHLIEVMTIDEVHKIRAISKAFQKGGGPWVNWHDEMAKKTIIKRASKSWPQTANRKRMDIAVSILNEHEGTAYTLEQHTEYMSRLRHGQELSFYIYTKSLTEQESIALSNSFEKGQKTNDKERCRELSKKGFEIYEKIMADLSACIETDDDVGTQEILDSLSKDEATYIIEQLGAENQHKLNELMSNN